MDLAAPGDFLGELANDSALRELRASIVASLGEEMQGKRVLVITDDWVNIATELAERGVHVTAMGRERAADGPPAPLVFAGFQPEYFEGVVLSSVLDEAAVLEDIAREAARVVRPGGRFLSIDVDWETLAFGGVDVATADALRERFARSHKRRASNRVLPLLLQRAGFSDFTLSGKALIKRALPSETFFAAVTAFAISAYKV